MHRHLHNNTMTAIYLRAERGRDFVFLSLSMYDNPDDPNDYKVLKVL